MSDLYWLSVLGSLNNLFMVIAVITGTTLVVCFLGILMCDNEYLDRCKKYLKYSLFGLILSLLGVTFTPDRNEAYAIYGFGTVIDYAKENKGVKKIPDNAVKAINTWLESKTDSINAK